MTEQQQEEEKFYLGHFLKVVGIEIQNKERGSDPPDFVLTTMSNRHIAIEVTEFHSGAKGADGRPRRAVEETWMRLSDAIERVRCRYEELRKMAGHLIFKKLILPSRKEQNRFVDELIEFTLKYSSEATNEWKEFSDFGAPFLLLEKYLRKIRLKPVDFYIDWDWNHSAAFIGLTEQELKTCIRDKCNVSRPTNIDENWLLVVSGWQLSQSMGFPAVEELQQYTSVNTLLGNGPYDKVYIYTYMVNGILEWSREKGCVEISPAEFATQP